MPCTEQFLDDKRRGEVSIVSARNCAHVLSGILFIAFQVQWSIAGVLITPCLKFNSSTGLKDPMAGERPARVTAKDVDSRRATAAKGNACSSNRATRVEVRMEVKEEGVFDGRHQAFQMTNARVDVACATRKVCWRARGGRLRIYRAV
jgi:hypothetical protein